MEPMLVELARSLIWWAGSTEGTCEEAALDCCFYHSMCVCVCVRGGDVLASFSVEKVCFNVPEHATCSLSNSTLPSPFSLPSFPYFLPYFIKRHPSPSLLPPLLQTAPSLSLLPPLLPLFSSLLYQTAPFPLPSPSSLTSSLSQLGEWCVTPSILSLLVYLFLLRATIVWKEGGGGEEGGGTGRWGRVERG